MRARYHLRAAVAALLCLFAAPSVSHAGRASVKTLLSETVTTAVSATTTTAVTPSHSLGSCSLLFVFTYGSGGTTAKYWVQTSLDGGTTWTDVANLAVTTSSASRAYTLNASTPVTSIYTPTDGTLSDNTSKDGFLGGELRVKRTTTGTYAGDTTIAITATCRE